MSRALDEVLTADALVLGSGVAGLSAALAIATAAPRATVHVVTKGRLAASGATPLAQGGIAAALGPGDAPALHAADTLAAAGSLADPEAVRLLTEAGPRAVERLLALGARLDRDREGRLALGREAAHGRPRILHAGGDSTGAELARALAVAVGAVAASGRIRVFEGAFACELAVERARASGALVRRADGARALHLARGTVLATGGSGRLFLRTTNPAEATADGIALAARAGVVLADLELVQFHPTALAAEGADPMSLVTEALRGAGAILVDENGRRFLAEEEPRAELAARDRVARAVWRHLRAGHRVFLDGRAAVGEAFPDRFPTVFRAALEHGIDPRREPIPVSPAAHYHMGGVWTDLRGRTSLRGLWACGEVAAAGIHGANRLASNSLLEGLVFGARAGEDLAAEVAGRPAPKALLPAGARQGPAAPDAAGEGGADPADPTDPSEGAAIRGILWERAGLERDEEGLRAALAELGAIARRLPPGPSEARNLATAGRLLVAAALERRESRGAHFRTDYPAEDVRWRRRLLLTGSPDDPGRARLLREGAHGAAARPAGAHGSGVARPAGRRAP